MLIWTPLEVECANAAAWNSDRRKVMKNTIGNARRGDQLCNGTGFILIENPSEFIAEKQMRISDMRKVRDNAR